MKILHVHDKRTPAGGVQRYLADLEHDLAGRGHRSVVVKLLKGTRGLGRDGATYVVPTSSDARSGERVLRAFDTILDEEKPDLIHLHSVFTTMGPHAVRGLKARRPTVFQLHDVKPLCYWGTKVRPRDGSLCTIPVGRRCFTTRCYNPFANGSVARNLYRIPIRHLLLHAYRRLDRVIVANRFFFGELVKCSYPPEKLALVGLYTKKCPSGALREPVEPIVLYAGRLDREKGILAFIEMLAAIPPAEWTAEVIGDGPERARAEAMARELGLGERVRFQGWLDAEALDEAYARAAVVVLPSLVPENFGLVGIEAMAFGRPVVAFELGGVTEWLRDGVNGFLVARGDTPAMGRRVGEILADRPLAARFGRAARAIVDGEFRMDHHLGKLVEVYENALNREPVPS